MMPWPRALARLTCQPTTFGGALRRHGANDWRWPDGTPGPRVRDLTASEEYNIRSRRHRGGTAVEVLLTTAHLDRDTLGWVLVGVEPGTYQQDVSSDHKGPEMITDEDAQRMQIEPGEAPLEGNESIIRKLSIPKVEMVPSTTGKAAGQIQ